MGGRVVLGVTAAGLLLGLLAPAGAPTLAAESRSAGDSGFARVTSRAAEGSPAATLGSRSKVLAGKNSRIGPKMRRQTRNALRSSAIVRGQRPDRRMPVEPYIPQNACYAYELPGVQAFRDMLLQTFPRSRASLGIYNIGRGCSTAGVSEHEEGRALDFEAHVGNRLQYAQARRLLKYLTKRRGYHAKRWGIMYIIYNQQIWAQYKPWWRRMASRGNPTDNHMDHIHFSFTWNGALQQSPYWTGTVRAPDRGPCVRYQWHFAPVLVEKMLAKPRTWGCRKPRPFNRNWNYSSSIMYWQNDARVRWLQQFLTEEGVYDAEVNGAFGQITFGAVREWQLQHSLPPTGVWDPVTQNRSGRTVGQRSKTAVQGWPAEIPAVGQQPVDIPVSVTADGAVGREVVVQRRAGVGSTWESLQTVVTDGDGNAAVSIPAETQSWQYRLLVRESSRYRFAKSGVAEAVAAVPPASPAPTSPVPLPPTTDPVEPPQATEPLPDPGGPDVVPPPTDPDPQAGAAG